MIILLQWLNWILCAPDAAFSGFCDYYETSLSRGWFEGLSVSRSKSTVQAASECFRDQPLSSPMQPAQLHPADLYKRDSSLEFHVKVEILTVFATCTVKRCTFLLVTPIILQKSPWTVKNFLFRRSFIEKWQANKVFMPSLSFDACFCIDLNRSMVAKHPWYIYRTLDEI